MKKFMNACLFSIAALVSCGALAMDVQPEMLNVEISNQTNDEITIVNGDEVITVPSYSDKSILIKPLYLGDVYVMDHQAIKHITTILTKHGEFQLKWLIMKAMIKSGILQIQKMNAAGKSLLYKPRNPIIIFEEGQDMPIISER